MSQNPDHVMRARMPGRDSITAAPGQLVGASSPRPGFRIVIPAADGTVLLEMSETPGGKLAIEYDPERTEEAAMRFLDGMRQWAGSVGIRWQDEVEKAVKP